MYYIQVNSGNENKENILLVQCSLTYLLSSKSGFRSSFSVYIVPFKTAFSTNRFY